MESATADGLGWFWWIVMMLVFAFVIWLFVMAARARGSSNFIKIEEELEILKGRFANGEIDEAEFRRRKAELTGKKP